MAIILYCGFVLMIVSHPYVLMKNTSFSGSGKWINVRMSSHGIPFNILGLSDDLIINAPEPYNPQILPLYRGVINPGDSIYKYNGSVVSAKNNVTSEQDAPQIAESVMAEYGGLPVDSYLGFTNTSYLEHVSETGQILERWPTDTVVVFWRKPVSGIPIVGQSDKLAIELGENGEVLKIFKVWRTLENTGRNVTVITPEKAIEKLQNGESISPPMTDESIRVSNISLGFYEKSMTNPQIFLEPVWMFSGTTSTGNSVEFYVYARQFANFTATPTTGPSPLNVTFTDTSDATPTKWLWDFGDGTNSTLQNPEHMYASAGRYNISLKVWNDLGSDTLEKPAYLTVGNVNLPVANFTVNMTSGKTPLTVAFHDLTSNFPTSWLWEFGDNWTSTEQNPVHEYDHGGNFTVTLNATNRYGSSIHISPSFIQVTPNPSFPNFTAKPRSGKVPLTVAFTETSSGGIPTLWYWTFGDGGEASVPNPVHTYTNAGNYSVDLETANGDGDFNRTINDYITVIPLNPPVANFTATPKYGRAPLTVTFMDTSSNSPTGWNWVFGDGTNSTLASPVHVYTTAGNYTVALSVTNADGIGTLSRPEYISVSGVPPTTTQTTRPTTTPTTKPTRQPLSPIIAIVGVVLIGLVFAVGKK